MSPSLPDRIVEACNHVCGDAKHEGLRSGQIGGYRAGSGKSVAEIEGHQMSLHRSRGQADERNDAIAEVELRVEPEIVFDVVIGGPVGSAEFQSMRAPAPGHIVFKLVTLLMRQIGEQRGPSKSGGTARAGGAQIPQAGVDSVVMEWNCVGAIARNHLYQHLVERVRADASGPGAKNAEVPDKQPVTVRRSVDDTVERRGEIVVGIADTQSERIFLIGVVVKAGKDVVEPVRVVEDPIVAGEDRLQRGVVQRGQPGSNAVGKANQEGVPGSL